MIAIVSCSMWHSLWFDMSARPLWVCYFMREKQFCESGDSRDNVSSILLRLLSKPLPKQSDIYFVELDEYKREHDHTILQLRNTHRGEPQITSLLWRVLFIHMSLIGSQRALMWMCSCWFPLFAFPFLPVSSCYQVNWPLKGSILTGLSGSHTASFLPSFFLFWSCVCVCSKISICMCTICSLKERKGISSKVKLVLSWVLEFPCYF